MGKKFLLVPSCKKGNGTGHLQRSILLYGEIKKRASAEILLPCDPPLPSITAFLEKNICKEDIITGTVPSGRLWDFIIVDKRETEEKEWAVWRERGVVIGIDEGGNERDKFPFLIDILPGVYNDKPANIINPSFMELPSSEYRKHLSSKRGSEKPLSLLISFGGEDPAGLTEHTVASLMTTGLVLPDQITIVKGPLFGNRKFPEGTRVLSSPEFLRNIIFQYDLLFTSFGLTAFEAAAAGIKVVLLNPSKYHRKLSRKAHFFEVGVRKIIKKRLIHALKNPEEIPVPSAGTVSSGIPLLADFLLSLAVPAVQRCPVCSGYDRSAVERFSDKTFFTCHQCGMRYLISFSATRESYRNDYFFSEYKKQYGKTYLDDFDHIRNLSSKRLHTLSKWTEGKRILDVGCAYGPFLKESARKGWIPEGIEIVEEAAAYVRTELGIPVLCASFEQAAVTGRYDAVTMWFVLEHFRNVGTVLEKVNRIVKYGGLFAFSTPNSSGITGKSRRRVFYRQSPGDHFTIWNPRTAKKILRMYGFRVVKIRITGHHPERFPGMFKGTAGIKRKIILFVSVIMRLGDTFEVYAVKRKEISP